MLRFFGVATVPAYHSTTEVLGFRISDHARVSSGALAAWLRKGELDRWLTDQKVLIQLNLRYKWQDIFWFTLFHEVCHLLHHRDQRIIIDGIHKHEAREAEANQWAADFLVPNNDWTLFSSSKSFMRHTITEFARQQRISPGIVVGRLQREGHLKYSQHTNRKRSYRWIND